MQPIVWQCPQGYHNDLATAFYGRGDGILARIFAVGRNYGDDSDNNPAVRKYCMGTWLQGSMHHMNICSLRPTAQMSRVHSKLFSVACCQWSAMQGFTQSRLAVFALTYMPMMALAAGMCVPAGMFMPGLLLGGMAGLAVGMEFDKRLPGWQIEPGALNATSD